MWSHRGYPFPMIAVDLPDTPQSARITEVSGLCYHVVSIELRRSRPSPPQCERCQRYFHTSLICRSLPRCRRCGGEHPLAACKRPADEMRCCNCSGRHSADFQDCPSRRDAMNRMEEGRGPRGRRHVNNRGNGAHHTNTGHVNNTTQAPAANHTQFPPLPVPRQTLPQPANQSTAQSAPAQTRTQGPGARPTQQPITYTAATQRPPVRTPAQAPTVPHANPNPSERAADRSAARERLRQSERQARRSEDREISETILSDRRRETRQPAMPQRNPERRRGSVTTRSRHSSGSSSASTYTPSCSTSSSRTSRAYRRHQSTETPIQREIRELRRQQQLLARQQQQLSDQLRLLDGRRRDMDRQQSELNAARQQLRSETLSQRRPMGPRPSDDPTLLSPPNLFDSIPQPQGTRLTDVLRDLPQAGQIDRILHALRDAHEVLRSNTCRNAVPQAALIFTGRLLGISV